MPRLGLLFVFVLASISAMACGANDDVPPSVNGTSPAATSTALPSSPRTTSVTPAGVPTPTPAPTDWLTFADPEGKFTIRYPNDWYLEVGPTPNASTVGYNVAILSTFQLGAEHGNTSGNYSAKVDLDVESTSNGCAPRSTNATDAALGGVMGFRLENRNLEEGEGMLVEYRAEHEGQCFLVAGYFFPDTPYADTFAQMVETFAFTS